MTDDWTPGLAKALFKCPHCGAITDQSWYRLRAEPYDENGNGPFIPDAFFISQVQNASNVEEEERNHFIEWANKIQGGDVFFQPLDCENLRIEVENLWLSKCYACDAIAVWVHNRLIYPEHYLEVEPSSELPEDIMAEFVEAAKILNISPLGSAAILRDSIRNLCSHLENQGYDIDIDVAEILRDGPGSHIQESRSTVHVGASDAVHPGQIDPANDRESAVRLFHLINAIARSRRRI